MFPPPKSFPKVFGTGLDTNETLLLVVLEPSRIAHRWGVRQGVVVVPAVELRYARGGVDHLRQPRGVVVGVGPVVRRNPALRTDCCHPVGAAVVGVRAGIRPRARPVLGQQATGVVIGEGRYVAVRRLLRL